MKKPLVLLFSLSFALASAQFKIPYPTEADALVKLKTKSNIKERLSEIGASDLNQFTIKLIEKKCFTPNSDEVCFKIYQESKAIEGTSYWVAYEIIGKPDKNGDVQKATALVAYTRLNIGQVSCSARPQFDFDGASVDAFTLNTKNGLISVNDAEKLVLDTLRKGFDPGASSRSSGEIRGPYPAICRIDKLKTCNFNEKNCSDNYRVKNEMWENTHIIAFETTIYEGDYENLGNRFASMNRVNKMNCIVYCEFIRKGGKAILSKINFNADIGNRQWIFPEKPKEMPYDSVYIPIEKTSVDNIYGKFCVKKAEDFSLRHFYKSFEGMADDFNKNLGDDPAQNEKLFKKYFSDKDALEAAKDYERLTKLKWKFSFRQEYDPSEFEVGLICTRKLKKVIEEGKTRINTASVVFENGKWRTNASVVL